MYSFLQRTPYVENKFTFSGFRATSSLHTGKYSKLQWIDSKNVLSEKKPYTIQPKKKAIIFGFRTLENLIRHNSASNSRSLFCLPFYSNQVDYLNIEVIEPYWRIFSIFYRSRFILGWSIFYIDVKFPLLIIDLVTKNQRDIFTFYLI